jgi:hypothetical protein
VPRYAVETYLARDRADQRRVLEAGARAASAEITQAEAPVAFELAIHVPEDETCFLVFDAPSAHQAALAAQHAGLDPIRVVEAVLWD